PTGLPGHHPARPDRRAERRGGAGLRRGSGQLPDRPGLSVRRSAPEGTPRMTDAPAIAAPAKPRVRWPLSLIVGAGLTAVVLATALLALAWTPYDVEAVDIAAKLTAPSAAHPFGTDHFGRDVLSMIMAGAQNSLVVAFVA